MTGDQILGDTLNITLYIEIFSGRAIERNLDSTILIGVRGLPCLLVEIRQQFG